MPGEDLDHVLSSEFLKQTEQLCWAARGPSQPDPALDPGVGPIALLCKVALRIVNNPVSGFSGKIVSPLREAPTCCHLAQLRAARKRPFMVQSRVQDRSPGKMEATTSCNVTTETTSHHLCSILLVRSKRGSHPHASGRDDTDSEDQG